MNLILFFLIEIILLTLLEVFILSLHLKSFIVILSELFIGIGILAFIVTFAWIKTNGPVVSIDFNHKVITMRNLVLIKNKRIEEVQFNEITEISLYKITRTIYQLTVKTKSPHEDNAMTDITQSGNALTVPLHFISRKNLRELGNAVDLIQSKLITNY